MLSYISLDFDLAEIDVDIEAVCSACLVTTLLARSFTVKPLDDFPQPTSMYSSIQILSNPELKKIAFSWYFKVAFEFEGIPN